MRGDGARALKGRDEDGDYDVHYEYYVERNHKRPNPGNYTEDFSGCTKEAKNMDGQKNFEGFPLVNKYGIWDYKHTPKPIREKELAGPLCEDKLGIRYPGYWIKGMTVLLFRREANRSFVAGKFHYVKEMEPELIVPDLTDFPLKPYVSYRAEELEQPPLTAKGLFNLVYADDVYKQFLSGDLKQEEVEPGVEQMVEEAEKARTAAEKTGSDRFVHDSWYGIGVDKFD